MWTPRFVLALIIASSASACGSDSTPSPGNPGATPSPTPSADVFTTDDGVRFRVEVIATNLQIPWSLAFAPDGRLFVTERPGRVRIFAAGASTSEIALTV